MKHSRGFTLLEMLLATAIFALVGIASFGILTAITDSDKLSKQTVEQLQGIQRAFFLMERDFLQITSRKIRIDGERAGDRIISGGELVMESEAGAVAFTHDGWRNPGMILPRSEIQSVSYRMFEGNLERLFFNYPDPVTGEKPRVQVLLEELVNLKFEFLESKTWEEEWEKPGLPRAVKVTIETDALGEVFRIFVLTDNLSSNGSSRGP
ncbi:MAG: general secretion pathway protein J [Phenylobacterium sp.]|jgi:general secretion pathway protein J